MKKTELCSATVLGTVLLTVVQNGSIIVSVEGNGTKINSVFTPSLDKYKHKPPENSRIRRKKNSLFTPRGAHCQCWRERSLIYLLVSLSQYPGIYLSFTEDRMAILEYCGLMKRKQVSCIKVYSKTKKKKNVKWLYDENIRLLLQEKAEKLKVRDRAQFPKTSGSYSSSWWDSLTHSFPVSHMQFSWRKVFRTPVSNNAKTSWVQIAETQCKAIE